MIQQEQSPGGGRQARRGVIAAIAAVCVCLAAVLLYLRFFGAGSTGVKTLAAANHPDLEVMEPPRLQDFSDDENREQYVNWVRASSTYWQWRYSAEDARAPMVEELGQGLSDRVAFYQAMIPALLSAQSGTNPVCSP